MQDLPTAPDLWLSTLARRRRSSWTSGWATRKHPQQLKPTKIRQKAVHFFFNPRGWVFRLTCLKPA